MNLSREQCLNMKGVGILLIMVHNYVDLLMGIHCNEMSYTQAYTDAFVSHAFSSSAFWYILSYAGWIGVPLFFFVSGYGLTKKYGSNSELKVFPYLKSHVIKLWKLLVPVYLLYAVIYHYVFGEYIWWKAMLSVMTFTANFYGDIFFDPGVYWFFGVILQFYVLFLVFRRLSVRWLYVLLAAFVVIHYIALYFTGETTMIWVRHNFTGWGAPFILGMIAAKNGFDIPERWKLPVCIGSFCLLWLCLTWKPMVPLAELTFVVFAVSLVKMMAFKPMAFIGAISASIFVVHPFVRMVFYQTISPIRGQTTHPVTMTVLYIVTALLLSWGHHILLKKLSRPSSAAGRQ